jgi:hypothetical protein
MTRQYLGPETSEYDRNGYKFLDVDESVNYSKQGIVRRINRVWG